MVKIKNFSYRYNGEDKQLDNINLTIDRGEFILLSGPSGCGKTSLTRVINGLIPNFYEGLFTGEVEVNGKSIRSFQKGEIAKFVGNVFQDPRSQFFCSIVEDEIAFIGENFGVPREKLRKKVEKAAHQCAVDTFLAHNVFCLSSGQKQRVAIAAATIHNADILVFDEPSANLDYISTLALRELLSFFKSQGKTIIIAEHRLFYLEGLFDRFVYMRNGKIEHIYQPEELEPKDLSEMQLRKICYDNLIADRQLPYQQKEYTISNLEVEIKGHRLLSNLNFTLHKGEIMAVLGDNGIGKTTMAEMLCGLTNIKTGQTSYGRTKKDRLCRVFYVKQDCDTQLFFESVSRELLLNVNDDDGKTRAKQLLQKLGLWKYRDTHPQELSAGEKQRLVLAVACMQDRDILILDEPTAGLDLYYMEAVSKVIQEQAENAAILLISHDVEFVLKTCHRALLLDQTQSRIVDIEGNENEIIYHLGMAHLFPLKDSEQYY